MCLYELVRSVTRESTRLDDKDNEPEVKVRYLNFQNKIKTFCHFPNIRIRRNIFCEGAISDHRVEEYRNKLQNYWRSPQPDVTICRS